MRSPVVFFLTLLAAVSASASAKAQGVEAWPDQPVRIIVPFPAGGPADIVSRFVGERLSAKWGQPVVIENKPGANTTVAAVQVARATPNGLTLFVVMDVTMVLNPLTNKSLPYDPQRDFAPITMLSKNTSLLTVHADGPKTLQELVALGRANPGKLNFGAGIITTRLAGEMFNREMGITAQFVPYQGSPPTVQALLSKSVDFIVDGQATSLPLIEAGKFRALAKLNEGPVPSLPQLRSLAVEANAPGLEDISTWIALVAPAQTPNRIIDKVQKDVAEIYADRELTGRLLKAGINAQGSTPEGLVRFVESETKRWSKVVSEAGIELN